MSKNKQERDTAQITLRVKPSLKAKLLKAAKANGQNLSAYIKDLIQ